MGIVRPVFALVVALSMAAAVLAYMERQSRQDWIQVQGRWPSSPDRNSNYPADTTLDTVRIATGNPDPYLQRYHSHSEGWTYYNLPRFSTHQVPRLRR
jgi:hypothetical protein